MRITLQKVETSHGQFVVYRNPAFAGMPPSFIQLHFHGAAGLDVENINLIRAMLAENVVVVAPIASSFKALRKNDGELWLNIMVSDKFREQRGNLWFTPIPRIHYQAEIDTIKSARRLCRAVDVLAAACDEVLGSRPEWAGIPLLTTGYSYGGFVAPLLAERAQFAARTLAAFAILGAFHPDMAVGMTKPLFAFVDEHDTTWANAPSNMQPASTIAALAAYKAARVEILHKTNHEISPKLAQHIADTAFELMGTIAARQYQFDELSPATILPAPTSAPEPPWLRRKIAAGRAAVEGWVKSYGDAIAQIPAAWVL